MGLFKFLACLFSDEGTAKSMGYEDVTGDNKVDELDVILTNELLFGPDDEDNPLL